MESSENLAVSAVACEFFFEVSRVQVKQIRHFLLSFICPPFSLSLSLSSFFYLLDRLDGEPQSLGFLRRAAELVRGEGEARGAGRAWREAGGQCLMMCNFFRGKFSSLL